MFFLISSWLGATQVSGRFDTSLKQPSQLQVWASGYGGSRPRGWGSLASLETKRFRPLEMNGLE